MVVSGGQESHAETTLEYDRTKELKAFDETKAGVKGLTDTAVVAKIPRIFVRPAEELAEELNCRRADIQVPVIDLGGIQRLDRRKEIVNEIRTAATEWGFFQVVEHGIPVGVLEQMIEGVRLFHEQDVEAKKEFYTRDNTRSVLLNSNYDLFISRTANWRDSLIMAVSAYQSLESNYFPAICREMVMAYAKHIENLARMLFRLLSEALGLKADHLETMECAEGFSIVGHYYPACPEPELAIGTSKHSDIGFLTILLQSQLSGLQVLCEDQWVDVPPTPGALVINIGDLLQLVSNDKLKSNKHRVLANRVGPRISVPCFFYGPVPSSKLYSSIKELISEGEPSPYGEVQLDKYIAKFFSTGLDEYQGLDYYRGKKTLQGA
ncbi:hypothetical protein RJ640_001519 [Escallonia rubra]|uniref:Fe2OG dioxygenase domain-containing protein n=1 Tax=Escallonia rubra TaxID=112253 RepID=A0AA88U0U8_9ASTE|nr:hypothetical protein RJ640_001519 [Escallonia rubra]